MTTFAGILVDDHPGATSDADIRLVHRRWTSPAPQWRPSRRRRSG